MITQRRRYQTRRKSKQIKTGIKTHATRPGERTQNNHIKQNLKLTKYIVADKERKAVAF